jgi:hypothetical protein
MKKLNLLLLVTFVCVLVLSTARYAFSADIGVSASIPSGTPSVTVTLKELDTPGQDPGTSGTEVGSMSFGELTHFLSDNITDAGVWYSQKYYCAFIYTQSWGSNYEIRSSCAGLSDGTNSLPAGSLMLTPGYIGADRWNGDDPLTAQDTDDTPPGTLGSVTRGITGNGYAVVYTSEDPGTNRILRAFYSIPGYLDGGAKPYADWQPITLDQPGSTTAYSGTVSITIAAI